MARKRQFRMVPVPAAICATGGYTAQFTDQEEAKDALEFMPAILRNAGIRLDQAIFAKFCRRVFEKMVEHTAKTGEWATWTKVMTSRLYILGRFEAPDATVPTENIELVVIPLEGFRLDLTGWTLQNVNAGNTLELKTISDQGGTDMGAVTGTKPIEIHGVNCPVDASKEDEGVWLSAKAKSGEEIVMRKLTVVSSDVKTVVVANPGALLAPFEKATFTVRSRAGNPEGLPQEKEISAAVKCSAAPKKVVSIDALTVDRESESIAIAVTHPEGTSEYSASGEFELVKVKLEAGGEEVSTFFGRNKGSEVPFSVSEWPTGLPKEGKLTVTLTPDPDKADEYDQTPAVKTEA